MSPDPQRTAAVSDEFNSTGARLVTVDGRDLPLRRIDIRGQAQGGLARITLEQRFQNPYSDPLRVTYQMPLPPEGAVSGYAFRIGERRIVGEVDRVGAARERFEEALVEGRTAGLLEQDRSSLFTQEIGNIPPGVEVVAELIIDQRLRWLEEGAWEWRFPTVVAPRYQGGPGRVADARRVTVDVADGPLPVTVHLALTIRDPLGGAHEVHSPSHTLKLGAAVAGHEVALLDGAGAALDRDLVVRWQGARSHVVTTLAAARPAEDRPHAGGAYGVLTLTPPLPEARPPALPRDLIVLLDMSGSMAGEPFDQARRIVARVIGTLSDADQLELIGFASEATRWKASPLRATGRAKESALRWLEKLSAGGGTEMHTGIAEALRPPRSVNAQRQIVLVTDGEIGFESEIVGMIARELPGSCRLHTVGVGPAVNRTLTSAAARAGRGAEIVVGLGENPMPAVARLLARLEAPLLTNLALTGSALFDHAPSRLPDVHAGAPALIGLRLRPEGGEVRITGRLGGQPWEELTSVPGMVVGEGNAAVIACYGREAVEDLEMRVASGESHLDQQIESLGLDFQIATRLTSWVAVTEEVTVDPLQPLRRERIPQALPAGLSAAGLGLRGHLSVPRVSQRILGRLMSPQTYGPEELFDLGRALDEAMPPRRPKRRHDLRGRIVLRQDREIVIEITVDKLLAWDPSDVRVVWADDTECGAEIDATQSTRVGAVKGGTVIRLVLRLDETALPGPPARILLVSRSRPLDIAIEP